MSAGVWRSYPVACHSSRQIVSAATLAVVASLIITYLWSLTSPIPISQSLEFQSQPSQLVVETTSLSHRAEIRAVLSELTTSPPTSEPTTTTTLTTTKREGSVVGSRVRNRLRRSKKTPPTRYPKTFFFRSRLFPESPVPKGSETLWRNIIYRRVCSNDIPFTGLSGVVVLGRGNVTLPVCKELCYTELACVAFRVTGCSNASVCGHGCWLHVATNEDDFNMNQQIASAENCMHSIAQFDSDSKYYKVAGDVGWRDELCTFLKQRKQWQNDNCTARVRSSGLQLHALGPWPDFADCRKRCKHKRGCIAFESIGCGVENNADYAACDCFLYSLVGTVCNLPDCKKVQCIDADGSDFPRGSVYQSLRTCKYWKETNSYACYGPPDGNFPESLRVQFHYAAVMELKISAWEHMIKLPYFDSPDTLRQSPWNIYFKSLYGASIKNQSNYPIDGSSFGMLYADTLRKSGLHFPASRYSKTLSEYQTYRCWTSLRIDALVIHRPPRFPGFPSNAMVEVTHTGGRGVDFFEKKGYWMYQLNGSGIFYNLGRTMVFRHHGDAMQKLLKVICGYQCQEHYYDLVEKARSMGLKSIQFTGHCDKCKMRFCSVEILDVNASGVKTCDGIQFFVGLGGSVPCQCQHGDLLACSNGLRGTRKYVPIE